jgi:hypothetical protein
MSKYLPATLGIVAMLLASTSLAQGRSELEKSSIKAATDCVAAAALKNPNITTLYREDRLDEVTDWIVLQSSACDNPLRAMRLLHDRLYGQGTGRTFLRGDYLADLPRAVGERIKGEVLKRIAREPVATPNASVPPDSLPPPSVNFQLKRGDELRIVNVGANDVLNMRKYATDKSPIIDVISPNVERGVYYLGESRGQWIFVQYDRAKGWVNSSFVEPITSVGGRIR